MRVQLSGPVGLRVAVAVVVLGAVLAPTAAAAPKTDVVVLENQDRITCEIRQFIRGRLTVKTDALDTINIYWERILEMTSTQIFEVETERGDTYYGHLSSPAPRRLTVGTAPASVELAMADIVRMTPLEAGFFRRIDGNLDLGFGVTRAYDQVQWTLNLDADYRGRRYVGNVTVASQYTDRSDSAPLSRESVSSYGLRLLPDRWFLLALGQVQSNEELSLDVRSLAGGGGGRHVLQTSHATVMLFTGIVYTWEKFTGSPGQASPELASGGSWDWFSARNNNYDFDTNLVTYVNVGGTARFRSEFNTALRVKFLSDFTFGVNGYDSFDSTPPEGNPRNDYGMNLSLGWSF
jgi:hypothetical protein